MWEMRGRGGSNSLLALFLLSFSSSLLLSFSPSLSLVIPSGIVGEAQPLQRKEIAEVGKISVKKKSGW